MERYNFVLVIFVLFIGNIQVFAGPSHCTSNQTISLCVSDRDQCGAHLPKFGFCKLECVCKDGYIYDPERNDCVFERDCTEKKQDMFSGVFQNVVEMMKPNHNCNTSNNEEFVFCTNCFGTCQRKPNDTEAKTPKPGCWCSKGHILDETTNTCLSLLEPQENCEVANSQNDSALYKINNTKEINGFLKEKVWIIKEDDDGKNATTVSNEICDPKWDVCAPTSNSTNISTIVDGNATLSSNSTSTRNKTEKSDEEIKTNVTYPTEIRGTNKSIEIGNGSKTTTAGELPTTIAPNKSGVDPLPTTNSTFNSTLTDKIVTDKNNTTPTERATTETNHVVENSTRLAETETNATSHMHHNETTKENEPADTSDKSIGSSDKSENITTSPLETHDKSRHSTSIPANTLDKPTVTSEKPTDTSDKSITPSEKPENITTDLLKTPDKPKNSTDIPADKPNNVTKNPTNKHENITTLPLETPEKPKNSTDIPADKPNNVTKYPSNTHENITTIPLETSDNPKNSTDIPADKPNNVTKNPTNKHENITTIRLETSDNPKNSTDIPADKPNNVTKNPTNKHENITTIPLETSDNPKNSTDIPAGKPNNVTKNPTNKHENITTIPLETSDKPKNSTDSPADKPNNITKKPQSSQESEEDDFEDDDSEDESINELTPTRGNRAKRYARKNYYPQPADDLTADGFEVTFNKERKLIRGNNVNILDSADLVESGFSLDVNGKQALVNRH